MGSVHDAHNLTEDMISHIGTLGGDELIQRISDVKSLITSDRWETATGWRNKSLLRKLSSVSAPEGKERVVAIFDYWSQTALKPLHDEEMRLLRKIKSDCTFSHTSPFKALPEVGPYWSLDLTAATDRFPADLQRDILAALVKDDQYASSWYQIMTQGLFTNPWTTPVKYGVGQPMGAYSSWSTFALSHHLAVAVASTRAGLGPHWNKYVLLGDDIVLSDNKVASEYLALMAELGVEISETKSHASKDTFEFAKRWYREGLEITGIQLSQFTLIENWSQLAEALRTSLSRWSLAAHKMEPGSLIRLLRIFSQRERDVMKMLSYLHLPRQGEVIETRQEKVNFLSTVLFSPAFGCFPRYYMREDFIIQTLSEVKTGYVEKGIVNAFKLVQDFIRDLAKKEWVNELPDQGLLLKLPMIQAIREEAIALQSSMDSLRTAYYDSDEDIVFSNILVKMTDPSRVMSDRKIKMMISTRAALVNNYKLWSVKYFASRDALLASENNGEEAL